jgi:hypothetical protein
VGISVGSITGSVKSCAGGWVAGTVVFEEIPCPQPDKNSNMASKQMQYAFMARSFPKRKIIV